jgi:hypothetical protein
MAAVLSLAMIGTLKPASASPQSTIIRVANGCGGYDFHSVVVDDSSGEIIFDDGVIYSTCSG